MLKPALIAAALGLGACATAPAPSVTAPGPAIVLAVAQTGPDVQVAAYVRIHNAGEADRLVAVRCECADGVEIHNTFNREMHTLPHLDAPAGADLEIRPGGPTHLMLMGLRRPIALGERVPMTLRFENAGEISVEFTAVESSRSAWQAIRNAQ
jgi:copper(I)-binding protein